MRISDWSSDVCSSDLWQLRTAWPSRCTVQAPQSPVPQPYLVPVRPSSSRRYHRRGVSGSPSNWRSTPLTLRLTIRALPNLSLMLVPEPGSVTPFLPIRLLTDSRMQAPLRQARRGFPRSEEHTSELQSLMRIPYDVFCLKQK